MADIETPRWLGVTLRPRDHGRIQGTVVVYVVISEKGLPSKVRVFHSLSPSLDEQVVKAVRQWGFAPARKNGVPVVFGALIAETIQQ
jgi:TonB family protein